MGHVLIGAVPPLQRAAAEHLALRTDQMVPTVDEVPLGNHAALLVGVDRYVGCNALSLKEFSELADAVRRVRRSDTGFKGSFSSSSGRAFHSPSEA